MSMRKRLERSPRGDRLTVLGQSAWGAVCVYFVFVLAGAGVGWLVGFLADWLVTLPGVPLQGPAELVASVPAPWLPAAGSVAGLALGLDAQHEQLVIRLSDDRAVLTSKGRAQEFSRDVIAAVFRDGKQLVLLGHDSGELTRQECDLDVGRVADAFTEHGYVWADADPHKDEFRRWVRDTPGLPEGANAILKARQESLEKKSPSDDDVRELREELARLGVVVRDEKRRQYWRTFRNAGPAVE
ncbi:YqeB family protein [Streptomyces caniscabiei]|uniref:YqeB family protein n=1 Tax=Streptomyces caniscabiei TaxID=2746961 RepID=UPI0038F7A9BD